MKPFRHIEHPLRIHSGQDCLGALEADLDRKGLSRAVIFTGATLARSPLLDLVRANAGVRCVGVYAGVRTHTPKDAVEDAVVALNTLAADAIIVLGGGSAVVTARAASIFQGEVRDLDEICTRRIDHETLHSPRLLRPKIPLIVAPTTPNTAYVKAGAGVFDPIARERKAIFDPQTRARSIFLHPDLLMSAPRDLVISASLDTLVLALEGLLSNRGDPMSDALQIHAIRLLNEVLPRFVQSDDPDLRLDLTMAGILSGRGTDHAPAGATTALGHAIGANHYVANGIAKAVILASVMRFNAGYARRGNAMLATAMNIAEGPDLTERIIDRLTQLFTALQLPRTLSDLGLAEAALPDIADRAMKDWFILGNVRPIQQSAELQDILFAAL